MSIKNLAVFSVLFLQVVCNPVLALPDGPLPDAVFDRDIKTVQFHKEGWDLSYPILDMDSKAPLILSFDVMGQAIKNYNYEIVYCDAGWTPSRLSYNEYLDGFFQTPLYDFQSSFSTYIPYRHYEVRVPDDNTKLKLPGNYVFVLFEGSSDDEPVLTKRFVVVDNKVDIDARVRRPTLPKYQETGQEVDFTINHPDYPIDNPMQTITVVVAKNNQWSFSVNDLKPLFIRPSQLVYDYEEENVFPGGNEYRSFDTKSLKYHDANIASIDYVNSGYEMRLVPDKPRDQNPYLYQEDIDGKYVIQNQQGTNPSLDAEYVVVNFALKMDEMTEGKDVYVFGGFSDNNCYDDDKMIYDADNQMYHLAVPLKQGYYNYEYVVKDRASGQINDQAIEGSYYETENDYVIYVYHRPFGARNDRLIGLKIVNSLKVNQ